MPKYVVRRHRAIWETITFTVEEAESPEQVASFFDELLEQAIDDDDFEISSGDSVVDVPDEVEITAYGNDSVVLLTLYPDGPKKPDAN